MKKRMLSFVMALTVLCSITLFPTVNASATGTTEMPNEPIIYGLDYYTGYLANDQEYDYYLLVVPANGTIKVTGYSSSRIFGVDLQVRDTRTLDVLKEGYIGTYTSKESPSKFTLELKKGTYYLTANSSTSNVDYAFRMDYDFSTTTKAKVTSPGAGKIKITAPKGSNVDGFEIRYKVYGASTWTNKVVKGNKTLNITFSKLKLGKKYTVQTRKYVYDQYGYKYYSPWTEKQYITVKK